MRKSTRSISGVSVVAVMTPHTNCPHGVCAYCPKGKNAPQSYTGEEPAARRALRNKFSPQKQVENRLRQLKAIGHPTDKIELIIMGGTFTAQPFSKQKKFVMGCLEELTGKKASFEKLKKFAETSKRRPVGITFETRPDYCSKKEINEMLGLGATRVELGVQTIYDKILEKVDRKCNVADLIKATQLLKDSGLKVCYHLMPGLPGSSSEKDLKMFKEIFENPVFKPDMIKIYPTLVVKGTKLYKWWKAGKYKPLETEKAVELISKAKSGLPKWVRVMRITRDIPAQMIEAGVKKGDLRLLVQKRMEELGTKCKCIRCREVGHVFRKKKTLPKKIEVRTEKYTAGNGTEFFISAEDFKQGILIGYLRLRFPSRNFFRKEIDKKTAIVRELHVYGPEVLIGAKPGLKYKFQHRGFGKKLLKEAEKIARQKGYKKLLVLSGIGAKKYYRKLGYRSYGVYMMKRLVARRLSLGINRCD